jgi:biotin-[acetyl-CoA-carboxylase] ligase BirA-like protein
MTSIFSETSLSQAESLGQRFLNLPWVAPGEETRRVKVQDFQSALAELPLAGFRFFSSIGSTNDEALAWAREGAPDLSLVAADEQTAGRGRSGRKWFTPPGSALAFSLILRPTAAERTFPARITGLSGLALVDVCRKFRCSAQIKWPNDVLINGRKAAGILTEASWTGPDVDAFILGVGINVGTASLPTADQFCFLRPVSRPRWGIHLTARNY